MSPRSLLPLARLLPAAITLALPIAARAAANDAALEFSDGFLIGGSAIDMSRYTSGDALPPGDYAVDIFVNDRFLQARDIRFITAEGADSAIACLPPELLAALPLKPAFVQQLQAQPQCPDLSAIVEGATVRYQADTLRLAITVPQAAQANAARGYVPPELRDPGINAAFFDYSASHNRGTGGDNSYLGLRAGVNLGNWRLRHRTSFSRTGTGTRQNVISSDLQRDLPAWDSQLLLGQGHTGGELFESIPFTGVRVATDERMLPDSLRGFAPFVQGIAEGNARVTIRQNGAIIHEVNVPPGPFLIDDLYPTNFGGDLQVTVTEADGREQSFNVNFSAVPQALRAGASRFSATAGAVRDTGSTVETLRFAEGTYARGLGNQLTVLGGAQLAQGYQAALAGVAINTAIGAFGADITHSRARLHGRDTPVGNSFRLNYQRYVARTGTNFGLAAYRYSTEGFLTLNDAARAKAEAWGHGNRARQRYQVNFSQKLGERSTAHLSGGHIAYWDSTRAQNDFQLGVQSTLGRLNYGVSALRYRLKDGRMDTRYALTFSLPLGRSIDAPRLNSQLSRSAGQHQQQYGINGTLGERRALSYGLSSNQGRGAPSSHSVYASYLGSLAHLNAGYSRGGSYRSDSIGAVGSVVLHSGGVQFGQPVGEGFVLVQAPGAQGARVGSGQDIRIGRNGYALVPHVSPYRWNAIELDPSGLPMEVELLRTSWQVAPTAGGIVRVPFEVRRERSLFIEATDALGQSLPFAAPVETEDGQPMGVVGQGGVIQVRGANDEGVLVIDRGGAHQCRITYQMPPQPDDYGLYWTRSLCRPFGLADSSPSPSSTSAGSL